jgi:hypothetical protein
MIEIQTPTLSLTLFDLNINKNSFSNSLNKLCIWTIYYPDTYFILLFKKIKKIIYLFLLIFKVGLSILKNKNEKRSPKNEIY